GLVENLVQLVVQLASRMEIAPEWLFDYHARVVGRTRSGEPLGNRREQAGRNRQIEGWPHRTAELGVQSVERRRVAVVAVDVVKQLRQAPKRRLIQTLIRVFYTGTCARTKLIESPAGFRDTDDGHVEVTAPHQRLESRKDLLVREISRGAEEYQSVGRRLRRIDGAEGPAAEQRGDFGWHLQLPLRSAMFAQVWWEGQSITKCPNSTDGDRGPISGEGPWGVGLCSGMDLDGHAGDRARRFLRHLGATPRDVALTRQRGLSDPRPEPAGRIARPGIDCHRFRLAYRPP